MKVEWLNAKCTEAIVTVGWVRRRQAHLYIEHPGRIWEHKTTGRDVSAWLDWRMDAARARELARRNKNRETLAREVEVAQGRAAVLAMMLQRMVDTFPELRWGLTSAAQQQVLRDVRAVLEEGK